MIYYRTGDVLNNPNSNIIMHGCNYQGVMGSGIAKQIKLLFPESYEYYRKIYLKDGLKLGDIQVVETNGKVIINAMTQEFYGTDKRQVSYDALVKCFEHVNDLDCAISMPKIGAGLGGGDWNIIHSIIENTAKFDVYVYSL